jgi:hypothetical protein
VAAANRLIDKGRICWEPAVPDIAFANCRLVIAGTDRSAGIAKVAKQSFRHWERLPSGVENGFTERANLWPRHCADVVGKQAALDVKLSTIGYRTVPGVLTGDLAPAGELELQGCASWVSGRVISARHWSMPTIPYRAKNSLGSQGHYAAKKSLALADITNKAVFLASDRAAGMSGEVCEGR